MVVSGVLCASALRELPDGLVHIDFLDVGQGDAILIVTPSGNRILVDAGPKSNVIEPLRRGSGLMRDDIDLVLITHFDSDHCEGLLAVLDQFHVGQIMITGVEQGSSLQSALLKKIHDKGVPVWIGWRATDLQLDTDVVMDLLWPWTSMAGMHVADANDTSIVFRLMVAGRSVLLATGDAGFAVEDGLVEKMGGEVGATKILHSDMLKIGHHGSRFSSGLKFLQAVGAKWDIISVGAKNKYGHPTEETLGRLREVNAVTGGRILMTKDSGTIEVVVDSGSGEVEKVLNTSPSF